MSGDESKYTHPEEIEEAERQLAEALGYPSGMDHTLRGGGERLPQGGRADDVAAILVLAMEVLERGVLPTSRQQDTMTALYRALVVLTEDSLLTKDSRHVERLKTSDPDALNQALSARKLYLVEQLHAMATPLDGGPGISLGNSLIRIALGHEIEVLDARLLDMQRILAAGNVADPEQGDVNFIADVRIAMTTPGGWATSRDLPRAAVIHSQVTIAGAERQIRGEYADVLAAFTLAGYTNVELFVTAYPVEMKAV